MKQYTNEIQTAKLIELGLPRPRCLHDGVLAYNIGELIEFIPDAGDNLKYRRIFGTAVLYYGREMIYQFDEELELIDNLFDMIVKLKEYGEI